MVLHRAVTIDDVARAASVSRQTVSRVLNAKGEIAPETRARVQAIITELGYRPNLLARSLITRTTHTIGLVVPNISQPFLPEIARGIKECCQTGGYQLLLAYSAEGPREESESLHQLGQQRVDGVVVVNSRLSDAALGDALDAAHAPEVRTSRLVAERLASLGVAVESGLALTGVKAILDSGRPGPTVAILGELDSVLCRDHPDHDPRTGAVHACGHNAQVASMFGAAVALRESGVL